EAPDAVASLTVNYPGSAPVTVTEGVFLTGYGLLGVYPFDENGGISVLVGIYSGGPHCCTALDVVTPPPKGLVQTFVAAGDTDISEPADVDGDGTYELTLQDDRFTYTFNGYSGSVPPRIVWKIRNGEAYDASTDPRFKPYYESQVAEYLHDGCSGEGTWIN